MKKLLATMSLFLVVIAVMAIPAKPGLWSTIRLADGTEVRAQLVGDEHGHYWMAEDGNAYQQMGESQFYQVVDVQAIKERADARRQRVNALRAKRLASARRVGEVGSYIGKKKAIMILVNFSDLSFQTAHNNALFQKIANGENYTTSPFKGSMADYFKAQSHGKFELDFDVVGPVTVSKKQAYYGENEGQDDKYPGEMVCEAVTLAKNLVTDWKQYDWDDDGYVDQVYVVYAGKGEADGGAATTIWPHAYDLYSANSYGDGSGPVTVATGLKVNSYACGPELNGQTGAITGIGVMCHEYSHCLGYPDFYDTDYSGGQGMCEWDLMDSGSYNGNSYQPAGYTSYERWVAGWEEPVELKDEDVNVTAMKSLQNGGESYIMYNPGNSNEYFLLENRQLDGWDASLPAAGLLILHVDYDASVWADNKPNDNPSHQRMTWIPADKKYQYQTYKGQKYYDVPGIENDPFPYGTTNAFNKDFGTLAKLYNKNTDGTYYLNTSVEKITQNSDGTISFNYVAQYGEGGGTGGGETPVTPTGDYLFYESFDQCAGKGGNDGTWSNISANSALQADNAGWDYNSGYAAKQCARFGVKSTAGEATTPLIPVSGTATLTFKAGAWNSTRNDDGTTLSLSLSSGSISPASVTITKGAWNEYTATITATGNVAITFKQSKGRFFLDEVKVVDPNATAIQSVEAPAAKVARFYTLDGRYAGSDYGQLSRGIYIVGGKKIVK